MFFNCSDAEERREREPEKDSERMGNGYFLAKPIFFHYCLLQFGVDILSDKVKLNFPSLLSL